MSVFLCVKLFIVLYMIWYKIDIFDIFFFNKIILIVYKFDYLILFLNGKGVKI